MISPPLPISNNRDREACKSLIEQNTLTFEPELDDLIGIFDSGRLAACGARRGRVLKMIVVAPDYRGQGYVADIVAELVRLGREAGQNGLMIFTRPCSAHAFTQLGFEVLVRHPRLVLLEQGRWLERYLLERRSLFRSGNNAVVMLSADPFTRADSKLVEQAAQMADTVYVLVNGEGEYLLPLAERLQLARCGVAHIGNVVVTDSAHYHIPLEMFPRYFLRSTEDAETLCTEVAAQLFAQHIAPHFQLKYRVVAAESIDPKGQAQNRCTKRCLEQFSMRQIEIPQESLGADSAASVRRVREALRLGDEVTLARFVPESVFSQLRKLHRAKPPCAGKEY